MNKIICTFTPVKRPRNKSDSSDSNSGTPAHKRQVLINSPGDIGQVLIDPISTTPVMADVNNTGMAGSDSEGEEIVVKFAPDTPEWAIMMYKLLCKVNQKIEMMGTSQNMLEEKCTNAVKVANEAKSHVVKLEEKITSLSKENDKLKVKLIEHEAYSKKSNLKFFNITESKDEDFYSLYDKVSRVISCMDLNLDDMYINNMHRLPHGGKGPRPVIVKFVSFLDRDLVWNSKQLLYQRDCPVVIREHYSRDVEENIRKLLPIRRAAIFQKMKVRMIEDKLFLNNQMFTVNNLHQLPNSLKPDKICVRQEGDHLFFFSEECPCSNWKAAEFEVDGMKFVNAEQFIMRGKALEFKDLETADKVMKATSPRIIKSLGMKVKGFSESVWKEKARDIVYKGIEEKFAQNPDLAKYLLDTKELTLVEASPSDKFWGIGFGVFDTKILQKKAEWGNNLLGNILMEVRSTLQARVDAGMPTLEGD